MQKIKVMPDTLASQVAAGEVVERPASVVKELLENSIDAGAGRVDILVRRGGTALIRVVDDGMGMGREDAAMSLERHATSKLRTSGDLAAIRTMGFRGEALPSIASVSRFVLRTREHGAVSGTEVVVEGGRLVGVADAGEAPGTQIEVRSLFYNVPARRKFLKSEATEFSHIEQVVRVHALAHPEMAFSLTHDERLVFQLPGGSELRERIAGLAGLEVAERLREVVETRAWRADGAGVSGGAGDDAIEPCVAADVFESAAGGESGVCACVAWGVCGGVAAGGVAGGVFVYRDRSWGGGCECASGEA
jgi:DNA mismatch repair protein MutL